MRERFEYKSSPSSLQAGAARDIHGNALPSNAFAGGNAKMIEKRFGVSGAQVLYVGDHIFTDVNMAKRGLSWRTCMILQELELEVEGLERGRERTLKLQRLFRNKDEHSAVLNFLQTKLDGRGELDEGELVEGAIDAASGCGDSGEGDDCDAGSDAEEHARLLSRLSQLRASLDVVESEISGLLWDDGAHVNRYWGYTTRAGFADKSHLMRQIEKYADIYTSRVSNFLRCACGDAPRTRKAFARPHICASLSHRSLLLPQVHAVQALHLRAADAHPRPRGRRLPLEGERVRRRRWHRLLSDPDGRCGTVYSPLVIRHACVRGTVGRARIHALCFTAAFTPARLFFRAE